MAKKILIIEDDKFLRKVINKKLSKEKYTVIEATDGEQGLGAVREKKPDLVLLDLVLPGIDGFEVLARMKKSPTLAKIPVIILSNLGERDKIKKGLEMGAINYLIKAHFDPGEIVNRIESVFNKRKK